MILDSVSMNGLLWGWSVLSYCTHLTSSTVFQELTYEKAKMNVVLPALQELTV